MRILPRRILKRDKFGTDADATIGGVLLDEGNAQIRRDRFLEFPLVDLHEQVHADSIAASNTPAGLAGAFLTVGALFEHLALAAPAEQLRTSGTSVGLGQILEMHMQDLLAFGLLGRDLLLPLIGKSALSGSADEAFFAFGMAALFCCFFDFLPIFLKRSGRVS